MLQILKMHRFARCNKIPFRVLNLKRRVPVIEKMGMIAAVVLPLWNIPLIVRIVRRKSSEDISLAWVLGVWVCNLLMAPAGFASKDTVWRLYNIINLFLFSAVMIFVLIYRRNRNPEKV